MAVDHDQTLLVIGFLIDCLMDIKILLVDVSVLHSTGHLPAPVCLAKMP
jgi:hypothetical protein